MSDLGELSEDEIAAVLRQRQARADEELRQSVLTAEQQRYNRVCHYVVKSFLRDDGTIAAQCKCGTVVENVKCPHPEQVKLGKNICCQWCRKVIIGNTGVPDKVLEREEGLALMGQTVVDKFKGNADD